MFLIHAQIVARRAQQRPRPLRRLFGMTLIELVITIAIAAILMTLAVPSFQSVIRTNRTATQVNETLAALNLARSEAVKRGQLVSLCPSSDQATCSGATDWSIGWILFLGADPSVSPLTILNVWPSLQGVETFTGTASVVTFNGAGESANGSLTFTYKPQGCSGSQQRSISINNVGRATSTETACSS